MIIIADTTPLNYLTLIGEERILPELFGRVVIPQAVFNELQDEGTPEAVRLLVGSSPQWLEVRTVTAAADASLARLEPLPGAIRRLKATNFRASAELYNLFLERDAQRRSGE